MIGALWNKDYETYNDLFNLRNQKFSNLMRIERDLMEFGGFSWLDIQKLKPVERQYHINRINEMLEAKSKRQSY